MDKVRVGIVGAGFSGSSHARALRQVPEADIVAIADLSLDQARAVAERVGAAQCFNDPAQMLRDVELDAIHNCTPNAGHAAVTLEALQRGVHVLSEKPLAMNSVESLSLMNAAEAAGAVAGVCFNYRYYPLIRELRAMVQNGLHGAPHLIHGTYLQDWLLLQTDWNWRLESAKGGSSRAVADIGSHWIDLMQYVTGETVDEVSARLGRVHEERFRPAAETTTFDSTAIQDRRPTAVDTEDFACVLLKFSSGCAGTLTVSQVSAGRKNWLAFEIDARDAAFSWNQEDPNALWMGQRDAPNRSVLRDPPHMDSEAARFSSLPAGHPEGWLDTLVSLFSDFCRTIIASRLGIEHHPSFATFPEAHRMQQTVEAIVASSELGRWVKVGAP